MVEMLQGDQIQTKKEFTDLQSRLYDKEQNVLALKQSIQDV